METGNHLEPGEGWGGERGGPESWARLQGLLDLVRQEQKRTELSPERRAQIRERVLERFEQYEVRRRRWRAFAVAAGALMVTGVLVMVAARMRAACSYL